MACLKTYVLGIDVAKNWLDCDAPDRRKPWRIDNTSGAIADLVAELQARQTDGQDVLVVMEASGGQEIRLRDALEAANIPVHVGNAKRIRDYARAVGWLAKTDRLDATLLRRYGEREQPQPTTPVEAARRELAELLQYRRQLVDEITARKQQLARYRSPALYERASAALAELQAERDNITAAIEAAMRTPALERSHTILRSCPGVGVVAAASLLAYLPELGRLSDKQIASLAGLAPFPCDSGQLKGRRITTGGRGQVRKALYMAASIASQCNPPIQDMRLRLLARNKPPKVVRVALMRKLLVTLNALMRDQTSWSATPATA